jgi:hypothetical protein
MMCAVLSRSAFDLLVVAVMHRWCREDVASPLRGGDGCFPALHRARYGGVNLRDLAFPLVRVKLVTLSGEPDLRD